MEGCGIAGRSSCLNHPKIEKAGASSPDAVARQEKVWKTLAAHAARLVVGVRYIFGVAAEKGCVATPAD